MRRRRGRARRRSRPARTGASCTGSPERFSRSGSRGCRTPSTWPAAATRRGSSRPTCSDRPAWDSVAGEPGPQPEQRPRQQSRHVHLGDPHLLPDLALRQALEEAQGQDRAVAFRQPRQQREEGRALLDQVEPWLGPAERPRRTACGRRAGPPRRRQARRARSSVRRPARPGPRGRARRRPAAPPRSRWAAARAPAAGRARRRRRRSWPADPAAGVARGSPSTGRGGSAGSPR